MDVRCGSCGTEYDFDDALLSERGTTVQCTECGFQFKVFPEKRPVGQERWIVHAGGGEWVKEYSSVKELQLAIRRQEIGPQDLLSRGSGALRPLASIAELEPLFLQVNARSGGTLLGMVPVGDQAGPTSAPPTKAMPARHRVTTKLGLPTVSPPQVLGVPPSPEASAAPPSPPPLSSRPLPPPPLSSHPPPVSTAPGPGVGNFARTLPSAFGADSSAAVPGTAPSTETSSAGGEVAPTVPQRAWGERPRIVSALSARGFETSTGGETWSFPESWGNQTLPSAQTPSSVPPSPRPSSMPPSPRPSSVPPSPRPSSVPPRSPRRGEVISPLTSSSPEPPLSATLVSATPDAPASSSRGSGEAEDEVIALPERRSGGWMVAAAAVLALCAVGGLWAWRRVGSGTSTPAKTASPEPVLAVQAAEPVSDEPAAHQAPAAPAPEPTATQEENTNRDRPPQPETSEQERGNRSAADGVSFQTRLTAASRALHAGDLETAKQHYEAVLREHPGNVEALAGLADVAQRRGDATTAARLYEQVLAEHPSYVPALMGRADQYWAAGDRTRAVQLYERVLEEIGPSGSYGQSAQARIRQAKDVTAPSQPARDQAPDSPGDESTASEGTTPADPTDFDE